MTFCGMENQIKYLETLLIQTYENCGLKMLDIHSFVNSIKASWIKRMNRSKGNWSKAYNNEINKYGSNLVFKCNIHRSDDINICKNIHS